MSRNNIKFLRVNNNYNNKHTIILFKKIVKVLSYQTNYKWIKTIMILKQCYGRRSKCRSTSNNVINYR